MLHALSLTAESEGLNSICIDDIVLYNYNFKKGSVQFQRPKRIVPTLLKLPRGWASFGSEVMESAQGSKLQTQQQQNQNRSTLDRPN